MRKSKFKEPKAVLVFNGAKTLISIFRSVNSASQFSGGTAQSISFACNGRYISTGGYYYRHLHPDVEITFDDIDSLNLIEYDELCGVKRKYHSLRGMAKIRKDIKEESKIIKENKKHTKQSIVQKNKNKGGQDDACD